MLGNFAPLSSYMMAVGAIICQEASVSRPDGTKETVWLNGFPVRNMNGQGETRHGYINVWGGEHPNDVVRRWLGYLGPAAVVRFGKPGVQGNLGRNWCIDTVRSTE